MASDVGKKIVSRCTITCNETKLDGSLECICIRKMPELDVDYSFFASFVSYKKRGPQSSFSHQGSPSQD